jgi:cell division transport system permease protein
MTATEPIEVVPEPWDGRGASAPRISTPRDQEQIVPSGSIAGRSLAAVVAIMTFLAALTMGAVMMVVNSASDWQSEVGREITIQVRPMAGHDVEADVRAAADIARGSAGIADVRPYTKEESAKLIEPWLGSGLTLGDLPIPRMIVVKLAAGAPPDFAALRKALAAAVPSASLDDHRGWIDRMRTMAETAVAVGIAILLLVVAVTVLSVTFATRGAMATNRPIVEVLHYVGATDGFVAGDEAAALFGNFSIGITGYVAILILIVLMAVVTAFASRRTVNQTLEAID